MAICEKSIYNIVIWEELVMIQVFVFVSEKLSVNSQLGPEYEENVIKTNGKLALTNRHVQNMRKLVLEKLMTGFTFRAGRKYEKTGTRKLMAGFTFRAGPEYEKTVAKNGSD